MPDWYWRFCLLEAEVAVDPGERRWQSSSSHRNRESGEHALLVAAIECDVASLLSLAGQASSIR
jgi:hypothetical protein